MVVLVTKNADFPGRPSFIEHIRRRCPAVVGIFQNVQIEKTNVILGEKWLHLWGESLLREKMNGLKIFFSPGAFMQVNRPAAELMYAKAIDLLALDGSETVLDLFCGVGVMTLLASRRCKKAVGVESTPVSIQNAKLNAQKNGIHNVSFIESSVEMFLRRQFGRSSHSINSERLCVIVDPPRAGCKPEVIQELLQIEPLKIVYVSCDPATLARDLKDLKRKYDLGEVIPVDLFPQTSHIESIVSLRKRRHSSEGTPWNR